MSFTGRDGNESRDLAIWAVRPDCARSNQSVSVGSAHLSAFPAHCVRGSSTRVDDATTRDGRIDLCPARVAIPSLGERPPLRRNDLMAHHFLLSVPFDLAKMEGSAARDQNPRHLLYDVARRLEANVHIPDAEPSRVDKVMSKLYGKPIHWALARRMSKDVSNADTVFCA